MHGFEFFDGGFGSGLGMFGALTGGILILVLWSIFWKGLALWHSA